MKRRHDKRRGQELVRPTNVPDDANFDVRHQTWGVGALDGTKRVGPWSFYFQDGSLAGRVNYVAGTFDGLAEWFHRSGDLREQATYVAGKVHGKHVWQRTKKGKMPDCPWFDKLGKDTWRYEVARVHGDGQARYFTLYGQEGVESQVPVAEDGRSIDLGAHMERLRPQTVLMLVEECFADDDDEVVTSGSVTRLVQRLDTPKGRYVYTGKEMDGLYRIQFCYDSSREPDEYFVESAELSRAFTLAADYVLTALARVGVP